MKCFFHEKDAVSVCTNCGRGLCRSCIREFRGTNKIYCHSCYEKRDILLRNMQINSQVSRMT